MGGHRGDHCSYRALVPLGRVRVATKDNHRFVAFSFMLDPTYEAPKAWLIHFQAWQCRGGHPPFTLEVAPGPDRMGPIDRSFGLRDDAA
jgi:hypothetical protein